MAADGGEAAAAAPEEPVFANSLGAYDGQTFYLQSFCTWYRWRPVQLTQQDRAFNELRPESGFAGPVYYQQTMGRLEFWYELTGKSEYEANATEEDLVVDLCSWKMEVTIGKDGKPGKRVGRRIEALTGEFFADVRRKHSWWRILEDGDCEFPGRWLYFSLSKLEHRPWRGVWTSEPFNLHRKTVVGINALTPGLETQLGWKSEEEVMAEVPAGEKPDEGKYTGLLPEQLCTGMDEDVDETEESISLLLHFDDANLEFATGLVPMEDLFAAEVGAERLDVYLKFDGLGLLSGRLFGACVPEDTLWEVAKVRRKLPPDTGIRDPAFTNHALRIVLHKAQPGHWGRVFADYQMPQCGEPKERLSFTDRMQRALVLSPSAPMSATTKAENAVKLVTRLETRQDAEEGKAIVRMHIDVKIGEMFHRYKVDPMSFFSLKVGEKMLEVSVVADADYRMCAGSLSGKCDVNATTWDLKYEKFAEEDPWEHGVVEVVLQKADGAAAAWPEDFFAKMTSAELAGDLLQSLEDNPPN